ncbi:MAG: serine/threonine protein kinase [Bryobacteraceae bacterium]|nr:serine/threonine protein kinase [Bryobacteraceae bacterium]
MEAQSWEQVRQAFGLALSRAGADREAYVEALPGGIRREVRSLLAADEAAGDFLEPPSSTLPRGARIGRYEVLELVGRGGMGEVYRAVRLDGSGQQVALKILSPVFRSQEMERYFRRERQVLAQLAHPNIVRLLDSGEHSGRQYFVMEWVEGSGLIEWARSAERNSQLVLFEQVCRAVQSAHQSLVVHRDLKPSNILVTADGDPKLLDFGIARLLEFPGGDADSARTNVPAMSLPYASPEQARGLAAGIPSDLYSLGLILYEILAGRVAQPVSGLPLDEAIRKIAVDDPPPVANLPADLAAILRKSIAKEPEKRYASALDLAEDLRRYREGYPVHAQPPGFWYRARKLAARNRLALAVAVVGILATLAALTGFVYQYQRAREEKALAQRRFEAARKMAQALLFDAPNQLAGVPGTIGTRRWMAEQALGYLERMASDVQQDRGMALAVARGYRQVAYMQYNVNSPNLNDPPGALASLEKAEEVLRRAGGASPEFLEEWAENLLARPYVQMNRAADALANEQRLSDVAARLPRIPEELQERIWHLHAVNESRAPEERIALWNRLIDYHEARLAPDAKNPARLRNLAIMRKNLAGVFFSQKRMAEAVEQSRSALALDLARIEMQPGDSSAWMDVSFDYGLLGQQLAESGKREGIDYLRKAVAIRRDLVAKDPQDRRAPERLAWMLGELGRQLLRWDRRGEARNLVREAMDLRRGLNAPGFSQNSMFDLHRLLARIAERDGDRAAACREWRLSAEALPASLAPALSQALRIEEIRRKAEDCKSN